MGALMAAALAASMPNAVADTFPAPGGGTHQVVGAILDDYRALGGPAGYLGLPLTDELATPRVFGRFNLFQGGSVYWSPATGAQSVRGYIRDRWGALGYENGYLGFPTTNEIALRGGAFNHFQGGSVYWSPATGAQAIRGQIRDRWASMGWENSYLGYPTTSETPVRGGAFNAFQGGSVYWSPATGAQAVRGYIFNTWGSVGWEAGPLGYPTTSEIPVRGGAFNHFQGGSIYWSPTTGAQIIKGAIRDTWASLGWENSPLGYPKSPEYDIFGGKRQDFEHGFITWTPQAGTTVEGVSLGAPPANVTQQNVLRDAQGYLQYMAFSRQGLIHQLSSPYADNYSVADATWAVAYLNVDWYAQAVRSAGEYLRSQSFSHAGLVQQLSSPYGEEFTLDQAEWGVSHNGL